MNFILSLTFFAVASLATDRGGEGTLESGSSNNGIVDSLKTMVMQHHPEVLPKFLCTFNLWEKEYAQAFSIGLYLGKSTEMMDMLGFGKEMHLKVCPYELKEFLLKIVASTWKDEDEKPIKFEAAFNHLFNSALLIDELRIIGPPPLNANGVITGMKYPNIFLGTCNSCEGLTLGELRHIFAKHAIKPAAMASVDVTILKWLLHGIQKTGKECLLPLELPVVQAMCGLVMYPHFEELCAGDVLAVLNQFERFLDSDVNKSLKIIIPSLITVIKMLVPSSVRTKVEGILAKIYRKDFEVIGLVCRLLLGDSHDFIKAMEESIPKEVLDRWSASVISSSNHNNKLHSLSGLNNPGLVNFSIGIFPNYALYFKCVKVAEDIIMWSEADEILTSAITIRDVRDSVLLPWQSRLLLVCLIKPPAQFWDEIHSCINLKMLRNLIESSKMKQMILTYGVSILETTMSYSFLMSLG